MPKRPHISYPPYSLVRGRLRTTRGAALQPPRSRRMLPGGSPGTSLPRLAQLGQRDPAELRPARDAEATERDAAGQPVDELGRAGDDRLAASLAEERDSVGLQLECGAH